MPQPQAFWEADLICSCLLLGRLVSKLWGLCIRLSSRQEERVGDRLHSLPCQNTGVGSLSPLQGIFPTLVSCIAGGFFTS